MRESKKRHTIRDLAQAAGTSVATVSLVMNGGWKAHRINPETAERVREQAKIMGYRPNQRAQALRLNRSSLSGLMIPHHRNRFFAGLTENFERESLNRNLVPIIGSTQRDPRIEDKIADSMIAQEVELLVLAGVENPSRINAICREAGVRCANVDLPGKDTFSVVTDNMNGAYQLTRRLLSGLSGNVPVMFLGGRRQEYATELRLDGFRKALIEMGRDGEAATVMCCGYSPQAAYEALEHVVGSGEALPCALLVNSISAFEGFAAFWRINPSLFEGARIASFDWDPFAACLPIDAVMLRQDVEGLIARCFEWFDASEERAGEMVFVTPRLMVDDLADDGKTGSDVDGE
ncbi:LacI family DNA-binding transcriptional regulator [Paracoccus methylarcula]|uniref:LacI family DNA-binding transcriptional regulator n=2 Tax=Paracoccus methylarcula TaxID=72022 RepID=A0A422R0Y5_9RHOB|nr:LacI family DNA-binding transcriptional regulator [Paracoccus methylarcula]